MSHCRSEKMMRIVAQSCRWRDEENLRERGSRVPGPEMDVQGLNPQKYRSRKR